MAKNEKLEEAKRLYQTANADQRYVLENLFPELKELGDEIIREKLVDLLHKVYANTNYITCVEHEEAIAWLEKQAPKPQRIISAEAKEALYDKPKWTEEDSLMIDSIIDTMKWLEGKGATNMKIDWLKSIKQRMGGEE